MGMSSGGDEAIACYTERPCLRAIASCLSNDMVFCNRLSFSINSNKTKNGDELTLTTVSLPLLVLSPTALHTAFEVKFPAL